MRECKHVVLTLLPPEEPRLRCRHCHLTISSAELGSGCCPECLEASGKRRFDFDAVQESSTCRVRYCCEDCGLILAV